MKVHQFCGQTYDRSTSAYTSKKRSHRANEIDRFNILSHVAEKLDQNDANTFKCKSHMIERHSCSHYRHGKRKRPLCYRNFPFALNVLSKYNNTRKQYIDECQMKPNDHHLKWKKDIQTKISVDIRKLSCMNMYSNKKIQDSFICFGMIRFV
jgi:hypothetical protein